MTGAIPFYANLHNYFRPHEALKGKTPSEAARITVEERTCGWRLFKMRVGRIKHLNTNGSLHETW